MQGAVAIEFALIFSLLFALFYAIVSYALPLLMMQAFNAAAADGARAAVKVILNDDEEACPASYRETVEADAEAEATARLAWLQPLMYKTSGDPVSATVNNDCVLTVRVAYPNYLDNPPIPVLTLPGIGDIPRLPDELASEATIRL